jgi:hypothetical protein
MLFMDDETFLRKFEDCTYPLDDFHHREHVKVAYLYLRRHSLAGAIDRIRGSIKKYNAAHSDPAAPEVVDRGYHETMTLAWMRLVHFTLCEYGPADTADLFYEAHPQLWQMKVMRFFYSRNRIMSFAAKKNFAEPDISPLPVSTKQSS